MTLEPSHTESQEPAGIYVHIPFCEQKCPYCDFYSVCDDSMHQSFIDALEKEMVLVKDDIGPCDTVYFGGGTPTVLGPAAISKVFDYIGRHFTIQSNSEITIEANPGTISLDQLRSYRQSGISRINIGVQSFNADNLEFLGRIHTAEEARQSLHWARQAGFDSVGLDLIYGLPGQGINDWQDDLESAVAFAPEHISCYSLTIEAGTSLDRDFRHGLFQIAEDEDVARMLKTAVSYLADNGYSQYEVSNFANAVSNRSKHNLKYWNSVPYIGLGPSAHSLLPPVRRWNKPDLAAYIADLEAGELCLDETESLSREQMIIEAIYLGLRQNKGVNLLEFEQRFGISFPEIFGGVTGDLIKRKLLKLNNSQCKLTLDGLVLMDSIVGQLIDCIPSE